jgi:hypothetical protein
MGKVDFKKRIAAYTARRGVLEVVDVPPLRYLMIDGQGDPNTSQAYSDAVSTIFPVAYKLKFLHRKQSGEDYVVMPLEALWWSDDMATFTTARDKSRWKWTLLSLVPDSVAVEVFDEALASAATSGAPAVGSVRIDTLAEGTCVQTLHLGSYEDEAPILAEMHDEFIPAHGLRMTGRHHEIYFSDPRRTHPSKLRTLLRQPVEPG